MLKQLAPMAVIPPSPKNSAWMNKATDTATMEAQGPSTMAATPMPTACPVVPPGRGRLNIMITKENAAKTETNGTMRVFSAAFSFRRGDEPEGSGGSGQDGAGRRAEVAIGDVHSGAGSIARLSH